MNAIPYLIVATILLLLYLCERQRIKLLSPPSAGWIAFVVMLLFVGLRGHLYSDFINYYPFYNALPDIGHLNIGTFKRYLFEPGFIVYSSLIKSIGVDYFGWVAISTLIDLAVYRCIFRRYTDSVILPFLFFMAYNGLTIEFNLYRNAKAMDLFLLSLPHLEKRRIGRYMILNLLGTTFHLSSVVYLPLYFLLNRRLGKVIRWGGIVFANANDNLLKKTENIKEEYMNGGSISSLAEKYNVIEVNIISEAGFIEYCTILLPVYAPMPVTVTSTVPASFISVPPPSRYETS